MRQILKKSGWVGDFVVNSAIFRIDEKRQDVISFRK